MDEPALYFPYIHFRDENWLKAAVLYWPSVHRIVPRDYARQDSDCVRAFAEAGLVRADDPRGLLRGTNLEFLEALHQNSEELSQRYGVNAASGGQNMPSGLRLDHPEGQSPNLAWIHLTKFPPFLVDELVMIGIAQRGRPQQFRKRHAGAGSDWIGLHPALAGAYMTTLATRVGQEAGLQPVTDQTDLQRATPTEDVTTALRLLIGTGGSRVHSDTTSFEGVARYVMLAVQTVVPQGLSDVSATQIIRCREDLKEEILGFREYVGEQAEELARIASVPLEKIQLEHFNERIQRTVEVPLRRLERGLKLHKIASARSLLLTKAFTPPLAVGSALALGGLDSVRAVATAGVASAVGVAWWDVEERRSQLRSESPVGYLLDVRDRLTPKNFVSQAKRLYSGTY